MATDDLTEVELGLLEQLDEEIQKIDNHKVVRAAERLLAKKGRLQAARRALLGAGNKMTGSGGSRVTQGEVVAWFEANPGAWGVEAIAGDMGHSPEVIRGHLNRGKGERFDKAPDGMWVLRDPEGDEDDS